MKIRNGFVSNSSSSSFVVNFETSRMIKIEEQRQERKKKLKKIEDIMKNQDNVISLHEEIFNTFNTI